LVRFANKNEINRSLKIRVLLPNKKHATGQLQHHNLHYNIAVVSIRKFHCCRIAKLHFEKAVYPPNEVLAIGRTFETGKLAILVCHFAAIKPGSLNTNKDG